MSFGVGGQGGFTLIQTSSLGEVDYDPVVGAFLEEDGRLFYQAIADVYQLLADQEYMPQIWRGFLQIWSDIYLALICADAGTSLLEVPLDFQRKYAHFDLDYRLDLETRPGFTFQGKGESLFTYVPVNRHWQAVFRSSLSKGNAYVPLTTTMDERAALRWSALMTFTSWEVGGIALVGYFNSSASDLKSSLFWGVSGGRLVIVTVNSSGGVNTSVGPTGAVPLNEEVRIEAIYEKGTVTLSVLDADDVQLSSFSYQLEDGLEVVSYEVNAFGLASLDLRTPNLSSLSPIANRSVVATIRELSYFDPTVSTTIQHVPFLQDEWDDPSFFWSQGEEYELYTLEDGVFFGFEELPTVAFVLAEYVSHNLELIRNNFGLDVGLDGPNTEFFRNQVQAIHYAYWKGPTVASIKLGIQALLGLPFTVERGEVITVNPVYSGTRGEILVQGNSGIRSYLYPLVVDPSVSVGNQVEAFVPLTDGVDLRDWKNDPGWFIPYLGDAIATPSSSVFGSAQGFVSSDPIPHHELKKFHTFAVVADAQVFPDTNYVSIREFIETIAQTWKVFVLILQHTLEDDIDIDDPLILNMSFGLFDRAGGGKDFVGPIYGAPGEPPYDYQYGQSDPPLQYGMYRDLFPDDPLTLTFENLSGGPQTILIEGTPTTIPSGNTVEHTIP